MEEDRGLALNLARRHEELVMHLIDNWTEKWDARAAMNKLFQKPLTTKVVVLPSNAPLSWDYDSSVKIAPRKIRVF
jgi:hypothetical protein